MNQWPTWSTQTTLCYSLNYSTPSKMLFLSSAENPPSWAYVSIGQWLCCSPSACGCPYPQQSIIGPQTVETTNNFTYLGCTISHNNSCNDDIKRRIAIATSTMSKLSFVWRSPRFSLKTELRLYDSLVICVVTYSAASWTLTKAQQLRLDAFNTKALRRILAIRWYDRATNTDVFARTGQHLLTITIRKRRLGAFGHICRLPPGTQGIDILSSSAPPPGGVPVADHPYAGQTKFVKTSHSHMMMLWPQPVTGMGQGRLEGNDTGCYAYHYARNIRRRILNFSTLMHDAGRLGNIVKKVVSSLGMSLDSLLSASNSQEDTCNHVFTDCICPIKSSFIKQQSTFNPRLVVPKCSTAFFCAFRYPFVH